MTEIHIKKVQRPDRETGTLREQYLLPAMALETPQGRKLIPNPHGNEACVYPTLEEAESAARRAGYDFIFDGRKTHLSEPVTRVAALPGRMDDPMAAAVPILIERLSDKEKNVIANAAFALGELDATEAIPALCGQLANEDGSVRKNVADALAKLGYPAIAPLKRAWRESELGPAKEAPYIRLTIMTAFLELAHLYREHLPAILPVAVAGLNDESWLVRAQAALVIGTSAQRLKENADV